MSNKQVKSCLVLSYGPVPTPQYQTVEGGGQRVWGLAQGLLANGIDVTVGINQSFPQELTEHEGVRLVNWQLNADFAQYINSYDAVLISYCLGDPSVFVAEHISDDVQLILDVYVPIYIEISARESKDVATEYFNYMVDMARCNRVLQRGDYFLYANDTQELLYSGVLSALGVINPRSYGEPRLIKAPYGIHREAPVAQKNPYTELGITSSDFVVLWFGGIYPWFRIEEYLGATEALAGHKDIKFVFVGGKNPFNPNPDFFRQYDTAVTFAGKHGFTGKSVFFVDWVDFNERINWWQHADVVVSLNQPGEENRFSWRTRVMDYVWAETAIISNGGDPLSEELIAAKAAIRLPELSTKALVDAITTTKRDRSLLTALKRNVKELRRRYFWDVVTKQTAGLIQGGQLPYRSEQPLRRQLPSTSGPTIQAAVTTSKLTRLANLPFKVARKIRQKGVVRTAKIAVAVVRTQLKNASPTPRPPQFVFLSNPINNSGAPVVLLQIIEEYVKKYGANRIRVITPGIDEPSQQAYLQKLGIKPEQAVFGIGFRFIRLQLNLQKDDFVLMNTAAIYDTYRDFILLWLKNGRLKHAYWFIHEDMAQLPFIHKEFLEARTLKQIAGLVNQKSLDLLFSSKRTTEEYKKLIGIDRAYPVKLHIEVPTKSCQPKQANDFDHIDFLMSGDSADGRKGQLLALSAFQVFMRNYYDKSPDDYRPFKLHMVAIGENHYVSQQVRWIAESTMKDRVVMYGLLPKDEALVVTAECNATICCSLNETFGIYIAEGMLMGHVILRNNSAGVDEQLDDGKNGLLIDHTNIQDFAAKLAQILSKSQTSNKQLLAMSKRSQKMMADYGRYNYIDQIDKV